MFSVYCKQCGSLLLLGPANIVAVQNSSEGIAVHYRCHAGHRGIWLPGARRAGASPDHPVLRSTAGAHAPHLIVASATSGRPATLPRRPSATRPASSVPAASESAAPPGARLSSAARAEAGMGGAPSARPSASRQRASDTGSVPGLRTRASARRSRWTRAPWRRGGPPCGGSAQR